jgi:hypothetical protein
MEDWRARVIDAIFFRITEDLSAALVDTLGRHGGDFGSQ